MIDIADITDDISFYDSSVRKAENLLQTQLGTLDYAPDFGVDLRYFLSENFQFQNESFRAYLVKRMAESSIDVASVTTIVSTFFEQNVFNLAPNTQSSGALIG